MSAYLTVEKLLSGKASFFDFIKSRFWGVYPTYWLCVITVLLCYLCIGKDIQLDTDFWKSLLLIAGDYSYVCGVEWTLWYEISFYMLICCFFISKLGKKAFPFAFMLFTGCYIIKFEGINVIDDMLLIPFSRPFLAFIVGVSIYYLEKLIIDKGRVFNKIIQNNSFVVNIIKYTLCFSLFVASVYVLDPNYFNGDSLKGLFVADFVSALCFLCFKTVNISHNNVLVHIGNASYSIYLLHPTFVRGSFHLIEGIGIEYSIILHAIVVVINLSICFSIGIFNKRIINKMRINFNKLNYKRRSF